MNYVIVETQSNSDQILFWKPKSCGYTENLDEAGRYGEKEARSISVLRGGTFAVQVDTAYDLSHHVVARQNTARLLEFAAFPTGHD